jgi:hypothetical protein
MYEDYGTFYGFGEDDDYIARMIESDGSIGGVRL